MSYRKFKFISPGIFIKEIDNSQLPRQPRDVGPAIIGRLAQGPALKPVQVDSFAEFIDIFGNPIPGGRGGDIWRNGNFTAPTYAAYAAQAWLRNNSPATMVRLLGQTHKDADSKGGYAGWSTENEVATTAVGTNGGAYGLFVCEGAAPVSASAKHASAWTTGSISGTHAAIWYLQQGAIALSGQSVDETGTRFDKSYAGFRRAVESGPTFKVVIQNGSGTDIVDSSFDFSPDSPRYIRKVFNTDPTLTNKELASDASSSYWLGESFEGNLKTFKGTDGSGTGLGVSGSLASSCYGIILRLATPNGTGNDGGDFRMGPTKSPTGQFAKTGWYISQDIGGATGSYYPGNMQKLFRLAARELGEETQRKIKISIQDIRASNDATVNPYGSFTVAVRDIKDNDVAPNILEQYNNCNLNPASENYVARKLGNRFEQWDDTDRRYRSYGDFPNISDYVYVEMDEDVDRAATTPEYVPFGVYGPTRYLGFAVSGSISAHGANAVPYAISGGVMSVPAGATATFVQSGTTNPLNTGYYGTISASAGEGMVVCSRFKFPSLYLRCSSSKGAFSDPKDAYFGVDTNYGSNNTFDYSVFDVLKTKCEDVSGHDAAAGVTETSWIFSLDEVRNVNITSAGDADSYGPNAIYESGSRVAGTSYTAHTASGLLSSPDVRGPQTASYLNVIDTDNGGKSSGWDRFTALLHGGADGVDIKEKDPFNNRVLTTDNISQLNNAEYNSVNVAIDCLRDSEVVEYNLVTMPGITNNNLNTKLVEMCEQRADALAIIDLKGGYTPAAQNSNTRQNRKGDIDTLINNKKNTLKINSSYGCAYYPWVQIRDTINGATIWAPPSVAALGAMAFGEATSQLWFAPAGFTRGGLSANRAAGIPVVGVEQRLTSRERDRLYEQNINPIASFPAEGIVIFGQKTLQLTPSALDRINVRRLVLFIKKQISRFAATILFDQNVQVTWNRFKSKVNPFLSDVKAGLGIVEYKLILDETTTTPDLIDRNIMYAKLYVKPARAIEYIAVDFIITDSGASFED
jgi:hypothetical protein